MLKGSLIFFFSFLLSYIFVICLMFGFFVVASLMGPSPFSVYKDRLVFYKLKGKCKHSISIDVTIQSEFKLLNGG